jgi:hypothetical protein
LLACWAPAAAAYELLGVDAAPTGRSVDPAALFAPAPLRSGRVRSDPAAVGAVAAETARELLEQYAEGSALATTGALAELGVDLEDVLDTLRLVARVAREDQGSERPRLSDPAWLAAHFEALSWSPDLEGAAARGVALPADRIRLTSYVVYESPACERRTAACDTALYALPDDEADGSPPGLRLRYSRPEVYAGAYEPGGPSAGRARPLIWLSRNDANEALMQGTVAARTPDGARRWFNVHENNGIAYDPLQKDPNRQARFWYFREVEGVLGVEQIPLIPGPAVAGDVHDLGLGALFALSWPGPEGPELRLAVLADTGGAFEPNLFQLDWLAGVFPDRAAWQAWSAGVPDRVHAQVLVRKPE